MASTREERRQMRQRGAATRETKAVDFGFSFGGPALGAADPAPLSIVPEPAAPTTSTPPKLQGTQQSESQSKSKSRRTPGSARNFLPQRPSTYDIPSDDIPAEPRSNKRRKINPSNTASDIPSRQSALQPQNGDSLSNRNGETVGIQVLSSQSPDAPVTEAPQSMLLDTAPESRLSDLPESTIDDQQTNKTSEAPAGNVTTSAISEELSPSRPDTSSGRAPSPPEALLRETQRAAEVSQARSSSRDQRMSRSPPQPSNLAKEKRGGQVKGPVQKSTSPAQAPDANVGDIDPTNTARDASSKPKRSRGRPSLTKKAKEVEDHAPNESEPMKPAKRPRGRPSLAAKKTAEAAEVGTVSPNESTGTTTEAPSKTKGPRGRPSLSKKTVVTKEVEDQANSPDEPAQTTGESSGPARHSARKKKAETRPETEAEVEDPETEPSLKARRGRPSKKSKRAAEAELRTEPAVEEVEEQEPEEVETAPRKRDRPGKKAKRATEPEPEAEEMEEQEQEAEPAPSHPHRGRPGKKSKRTAEAEPSATEEQPEADAPRETRQKKKEREPRGETVPVTVHRLTNTSALGSLYADESGDENEESADELSSRRKMKLPNRGGVNPADVLSQICRETLEKTLTTLKNGIANETNPTRRAEWTRKRKAVETFGSELDGRLLDLSEMLDSNFVLGVQLKNSKRDMMDLRSHLYRVRRERETVALQMDAVRAKHTEEENAKTNRATINNSLHSLELALDRSQNRPSTEPSSADLEFMLRTVASDVSGRAPGAQDGLLNQIRAFNAQLESTAHRLERK